MKIQVFRSSWYWQYLCLEKVFIFYYQCSVFFLNFEFSVCLFKEQNVSINFRSNIVLLNTFNSYVIQKYHAKPCLELPVCHGWILGFLHEPFQAISYLDKGYDDDGRHLFICCKQIVKALFHLYL